MPSMEQCPEIREEIRKLCRKYPDEYWRKLDKDDEYPEHFVQELTDAGWLAALIPEQYGGSGLTVREASVILEEVNRSGRQRRRLPRPDVHHGRPAATR